jgi:lysophospholipase L1-like esterase
VIVGMLVAVLVGVGFAAFQQRRGDEDPPADERSELIVMLGDSITEEGNWKKMFPDRTIFNAGFSGYTSEQLIPIAREVAKSKPQAIYVLAGTNDVFFDQTPDWTADRLADIVAGIEITSPQTQIVVQTVLPSAERAADVRATNAAIRSFAAGRGIEVLDLYSDFDDGLGGLRSEETYDGIHLTERGYQRWAAILEPRFFRLDAATDVPATIANGE